LKVSATVAGADVAVGYFNDATADLQSLGVSASMPVGAVTVTASYVNETNAADTAENNWDVSAKYAEGAITATVKTDESDDWAIEGTYDMGNGLTVAAGLADAGDDMYVGGTYDLGGGASLLVSYADDSDADEEGADNDIGAQDYQVGTTVAVSFKF
jgi:predicted porin